MPTSIGEVPPNAVILCVDDNEQLLECEKEFLEAFGYTVLAAVDGGEGLELASRHAVDVVIVDYSMPEMNGYEFALIMRKLRPQAPVIMLSGAVDLPQYVLQGVDAFVSKPNLSAQLLSVIASLRGRELTCVGSFDA